MNITILINNKKWRNANKIKNFYKVYLEEYQGHDEDFRFIRKTS